MLFQGQEFVQTGSFNHWQELDWSAMDVFAGNVQMYRDLIALRRNSSGVSKGLLGNGITIVHYDADGKVLAYHRTFDQSDLGVMVVANFTNKPIVAYELPFPYGGNWKVRFNSDWKGYGNDFTDTQISDVMIEAGKGKVNLGPYSIIVLSPET
jgi:1,4-alpha-glucan branching enzyme